MKKIVIIIAITMCMLSTHYAYAEVINFNEIIQQSIGHSFALKSAAIDTKIAEQSIKEVRSEYFPTINAYSTTEYSNDLNSDSSQVEVIGNEIFSSSTKFQDSIGLGLSYNVYDYGIRGKKLKIAKANKVKCENVTDYQMRELKIKVAELYTHALISYKELCAKQQILNIQTELYLINERLNIAGKMAKTEVLAQAVEVAESTSQINKLKETFGSSLKELSYYTGKSYDARNLELSDIEETNFVAIANKTGTVELSAEKLQLIPEQTPEYKIYKLEIDKKQKELEILKRANLPRFQFDTKYSLYGSDHDNFFQSYQDLAQRNLVFRLTTTMPVFDGFKNSAQKGRTKLEIEKIKIQMDEAMSDLSKRYAQTAESYLATNKQIESDTLGLQLVDKKLKMIERLNQNGLIDKPTYLKQQSELLNVKFKLEQSKLKNFIAQYKLNLLNGENPVKTTTKKDL